MVPTPPPGFLDAASGEPLHPAARRAWDEAADAGWADPARLYGVARRSRLLLDAARERVADALACRPDEISFTASGTQAVHLAVNGLALGRERVGRRIVASSVEHSSVLQAIDRLTGSDESGALSVRVPVDQLGQVDPDTFGAALTSPTALACLQAANHEVGTRQPIDEVAERCRERAVPLFMDAAQLVGHGKVPDGWSVLAASAHKWGGPPGVGVLAIRTGVRWRSPSPADDRGDGRVPGFENVPGVVAAAAALDAVRSEAGTEDERLRRLTDRIREQVPRTVPDVQVVGHATDRLPHLVTFSCLYADGEAVLHALDRVGFAVSSGSSCTASTLVPSHVLVAMGVLTHGNIRVSLPRGVAEADVDRFLAVLPTVVAEVRDELGAGGL